VILNTSVDRQAACRAMRTSIGPDVDWNHPAADLQRARIENRCECREPRLVVVLRPIVREHGETRDSSRQFGCPRFPDDQIGAECVGTPGMAPIG